MEFLAILAVALIVVSCGAVFLAFRKIQQFNNPKPLLGVVAPQRAQEAPESIKAVRKVK
jgi:hypothetical protein